MSKATAVFREKAPWYMRNLIAEFGLSEEDAAAIVGNLGAESAGFTVLQEIKPLVPGSRGGWGVAQWTGPRRRAFERWVAEKGYDPSSDKANYGFLVLELRTSEASAIPAVKRARTLRDKVIAFERNFERAGIPHYDSRVRWAERALAAYRGKAAPVPPVVKKTVSTVAAGGAAATIAKGHGWSSADALAIGVVLIVAVVVGLLIYRKLKK